MKLKIKSKNMRSIQRYRFFYKIDFTAYDLHRDYPLVWELIIQSNTWEVNRKWGADFVLNVTAVFERRWSAEWDQSGLGGILRVVSRWLRDDSGTLRIDVQKAKTNKPLVKIVNFVTICPLVPTFDPRFSQFENWRRTPFL